MNRTTSRLRRPSWPIAVLLLFGLAASAAAQPSLLDALAARPIGPANMGGRIVDIAVPEGQPDVWYVAAATGGLWKTTDGGDSWAAVFDQQDTLSLGAVAVAPSDPNVVWVGTGEANARNSASWGDGVCKSTDGGKTWKNMGLKESRQIGRIVVHPTKPDIVFVAVAGRFWGPSKERGLYRTIDGGASWEQVKFLDDDTGFIDLAIDPSDPNILYAASCCERRDAFAGGNPIVQTGPHTGLFKSEDGGKTWNKMTAGLPDGPFGRCGLSVYRKDPRIVYAVVQTDKTDVTVRGQPSKESQDVANGGVFRSEDKGKTWTKLNDLCPRPFYFGQIRVDPSDDQRVYVLGLPVYVSDDGGKTFPPMLQPRGPHSDQHALWIDPKNSDHLVLGNDGGLWASKDRAKTWTAVRGMPLGQFYGVAVDMRRPYHVYGGLQDNGSWGGVSATDRADGVGTRDWRNLSGGDGFRAQADPADANTVYVESQYGNPTRVDLTANGRPKRIRPTPPKDAPAYRFNWDAPMLLSPHDHNMIYYGGNLLFQSKNRGDDWTPISPDLTRGKPGPSPDAGHTITAIAESPLKAGLLWVGTDDGNLQISRDGGKTWKDLSDKIAPPSPSPPGWGAQAWGYRWITNVECSPFAEGAAFVTIDRHRNDDVRPYIFKTTDYGETWTLLIGDLPADGPVHVVRQSSRNADLLFAGTEFGLFATLDGGKHWSRLTNGLPPGVRVNDLVIHPRDRDLVIGTHGRSIYVMGIGPLEEATPKVLAYALHLFDVRPATEFKMRDGEKPTGYVAPNPPYGVVVAYYLKEAAKEAPTIMIRDASGKVVATLTGPRNAGLNTVIWNLKPGDAKAQPVEPGDYSATITVGDRALTKPVRVDAAE
ncbi:MAG TPA: hypothetical protein VMS17_11700 [Gemmataceae bacterium]|nr:hypothetical protein [Gemmataceae bacterium]